MARGETFCHYINESAYEDEFSHDDINIMQDQFIKKARLWLHENKPGKYLVSGSWCVFVMTEEEAKKRNRHNYQRFLVNQNLAYAQKGNIYMDGLIIKKEWLDLVFTNTVNIDTLASKGMTQNEVISILKDELCEYLA